MLYLKQALAGASFVRRHARRVLRVGPGQPGMAQEIQAEQRATAP
jgi:hypothetical protein